MQQYTKRTAVCIAISKRVKFYHLNWFSGPNVQEEYIFLPKRQDLEGAVSRGFCSRLTPLKSQ